MQNNIRQDKRFAVLDDIKHKFMQHSVTDTNRFTCYCDYTDVPCTFKMNNHVVKMSQRFTWISGRNVSYRIGKQQIHFKIEKNCHFDKINLS